MAGRPLSYDRRGGRLPHRCLAWLAGCQAARRLDGSRPCGAGGRRGWARPQVSLLGMLGGDFPYSPESGALEVAM